MIRSWLFILSCLPLGSSILAAESPSLAGIESTEDGSLEPLTEEEREDELAFTQSELQTKFSHGYGLDLGPAMPWSRVGIDLMWKAGSSLDTVNAGVGDFEFSGNAQNRNFQITLGSQAFYYSKRYNFSALAPLYFEPFVGWIHWNGDIQPRGEDKLMDEIASSLSSRFDAQGVSAGGNFGFMWIFSNALFLDYKLMSLSGAYLVSQRYTHNTSAAREKVRDQLQSPISMNTFHLRIGYSVLL